MLSFQSMSKVYQVYGLKLVVYPFLCTLIAGVISVAMMNMMAEFAALIVLACLFGLSYAITSAIFGLGTSAIESGLLSLLVFGCVVSTVLIGLRSGAYFAPVAFGNVVFAVLLFVVDHVASRRTIGLQAISIYLAAALVATVIVSIVTIFDWRSKSSSVFVLIYPLIGYVYLEASLVCRLMSRYVQH